MKDNSAEIQELQNSVEKLQSTITNLQSQLEDVTRISNSPTKLDRYLDNDSKTIIDDVVADSVHNILWDNVSFTSSFADAAINITPVTFTVTIASPAVFSKTAHGLTENTIVRLFTTGALPTGLTTNTVYYVIAAGLTSSAFQLSTTLGGSAINTSGTQSGAHTYIVFSTTTDEVLSAVGRESDTSYGRRFKPDRESRFRTSFYIQSGLSVSTIYIVSPAVSNTTASMTGTIMNDGNKSFVGVKIVNGLIYAVSSVNGTETTVVTGTTITDATTHLLEIDYYISHAVVKFNSTIIGDIPCNLLSTTLQTFCPFLTSIKSSDGTAVNLTMESYEFLQKRK